MTPTITPAQRIAAGEAALLAPETFPIGRFNVRTFSGGDMLLASRLGLVIAGTDLVKMQAMTRDDQANEFLQIGCLLCHQPDTLKAALWMGSAELADRYVLPLMFSLTPDEAAKLVEHVARFFTAAGEVHVRVEEKPQPQGSTASPEPRGN